MAKFDEYYKARDLLVEILRADLVGPVEEDEVLGESPFSYYVAGKLYPQGMDDDVSIEMSDSTEVDDLEDSYDSPMVLSSQRRQSSMGLSFAIEAQCSNVVLSVDYATYRPLSEREAEKRGYSDTFLENSSSSRIATYLQRTPHHFDVEWNAREGFKRVPLAVGAELDIRPRPIPGSNAVLVSAVLVNGNHSVKRAEGADHLADACNAYFQTKIKVIAIEGSKFLPTDIAKPRAYDDELAELEMLYRDARPFALGHGCSADWDKESDSPEWVSTEVLPSFEVKQMKPNEFSNPARFSMKHLAEADVDTLVKDLTSLVDAYDEWIAGQAVLAKGVDASYSSLAKANVEKCQACASRMRKGIEVLAMEGAPLRAFRLANSAMLLQRFQTMKWKGREVDEGSIRWYPFQLGFLLMEICSFAHPDSEDRSIADLLWFPTGGGKTEAYLGVAAYAIFLRRLVDPNNNGVAVVMRYTLRLLTLQQFERASALIAACEYLRRVHDLGGDAFTIGMYVGGALTPNTIKDATEIVQKANEGRFLKEGGPDPFQVRKCPWCGRDLVSEDYEVDEARKRMYVRCSDPDCEFHSGDGIPAHVVDEDLYAYPPTFIVATVDKFAQVPLKEEAASLLGVGRSCTPPELIIQDELHLISGPLGTMVGVYEAALGRLCSSNSVQPKILTSTATAKSSKQQQLCLYGKESFQFPPQGMSMRDSFFAVESSAAEKPARLYFGVMGSDAAITNVAVRVSADLLFATRYLEDCGFSADVVDSFWTIVEYFNTLRELGGSLTSLLDSVQGQFAFLASTKFKDKYPISDPNARYSHILELTSRRTSSEITDAFKILDVPHKKGDGGDSVDFVLATNMLSVGVDIGRLGAMVVYGQPKMNSEYIQATSRVGRSAPGFVVSLLNPKRSRDRSHYEQFVGFHRALYKNVESSTLTPFSDRARDRSLHTLLVTLVRYMLPGMAKNNAASKFRSDMDGLDELKKCILDYVSNVEPSEVKEVEKELDAICAEWESRIADGLVYYNPMNPATSLFKSDLEDDRFRVMHSMRSVEPSAGLFLVRG